MRGRGPGRFDPRRRASGKAQRCERARRREAAPNRVNTVTGSAFATALAVAAGLAGSVQVALMSRLGERIGVFQALGFSTLLTAVLALALLVATRRSVAGYERALHQP